jgi:hypothetical protein
MLLAKRKATGKPITAYLALQRHGPFVCPDCNDEVILKMGRKTVNHFAHANPIACKFSTGESDQHRRCKLEIFRALQNAPGVRSVELELPIGMIEAAPIDNPRRHPQHRNRFWPEAALLVARRWLCPAGCKSVHGAVLTATNHDHFLDKDAMPRIAANNPKTPQTAIAELFGTP